MKSRALYDVPNFPREVIRVSHLRFTSRRSEFHARYIPASHSYRSWKITIETFVNFNLPSFFDIVEAHGAVSTHTWMFVLNVIQPLSRAMISTVTNSREAPFFESFLQTHSRYYRWRRRASDARMSFARFRRTRQVFFSIVSTHERGVFTTRAPTPPPAGRGKNKCATQCRDELPLAGATLSRTLPSSAEDRRRSRGRPSSELFANAAPDRAHYHISGQSFLITNIFMGRFYRTAARWTRDESK